MQHLARYLEVFFQLFLNSLPCFPCSHHYKHSYWNPKVFQNQENNYKSLYFSKVLADAIFF